MDSPFVHAVDNRNENMASINKTMWNYNSQNIIPFNKKL